MHVYHYNHTERSALERLAADHGVGEVALSELVETGLFVDLYPVVRNAIQVGTESYGLKYLERLTTLRAGPRHRPGRRRRRRVRAVHDATTTAPSWSGSPPTTRTTSGRRWPCATGSSDTGPQGLPWRAAAARRPKRASRSSTSRSPPCTPSDPTRPSISWATCWATGCREWLRQQRAEAGQVPGRDRRRCSTTPTSSPGLTPMAIEPHTARGASSNLPGHAVPLPARGHRRLPRSGDQVALRDARRHRPGTPPSTGSIDDAGEVELVWSEANEELGAVPRRRRYNDWVAPNPKPERSAEFAARVLDAPGSRRPTRRR